MDRKSRFQGLELICFSLHIVHSDVPVDGRLIVGSTEQRVERYCRPNIYSTVKSVSRKGSTVLDVGQNQGCKF